MVESDLRAVATTAGVELVYGRGVESLQDLLPESFTETRPDAVVFCDGARSLGRAELTKGQGPAHLVKMKAASQG